MPPGKEKTRPETPLSGRFAIAFVSALLMAVTLLAGPLVLFALASKGHGGHPFASGFFRYLDTIVFAKTGIVLIGLAGLGGFIAGPDRMADFFGFLWGTPPLEEGGSRSIGFLPAALVVALIIAGIVYSGI